VWLIISSTILQLYLTLVWTFRILGKFSFFWFTSFDFSKLPVNGVPFYSKSVLITKIAINIGLFIILICLVVVNSVVMKMWIRYIFNITDLNPISRNSRNSCDVCSLLPLISPWHSFTKSPRTTEESRYCRSVTRHLAFPVLSVRGFPFNLGTWSPPACPTRKWMRLSWRRPFQWGDVTEIKLRYNPTRDAPVSWFSFLLAATDGMLMQTCTKL